MQDVLRPIFFTKNRYNMSACVKNVRPATGNFRRVHLSNITATLRQDSVFPNMTVYAGNYISALPGDSIDDITLDHVHMIAPGGGSREEAERTHGHGDMYDFWGMYPEHLTNLGQYPGAVLYVRNAKGVRMNNCVFETEQPDARAAVAAECVDGLRMVAVGNGKVIAAGLSGKIKTACTMVGLCFVLAFPDAYILGVVVSWVVLITTVYSGVEYFVRNWKVLGLK
jgi:hypothetical protein